MKMHVNSAAAAAYLEGTCARKEETGFEKAEERSEQGSVIMLFPRDEEESEQYSEAAERRDRRAGRCLAGAFIGSLLGAIIIDRFLILSVILLVPSALALLYGLWHELSGRQ